MGRPRFEARCDRLRLNRGMVCHSLSRRFPGLFHRLCKGVAVSIAVRNVYRSASVNTRREITLTLPDAAYGWGRTQDVDLVLTAAEADALGKSLVKAARDLRQAK